MAIKIVSAVIAMILAIVFLAAPVIKLKDTALGIVILIGLVMMAVDLWQSLKSEDD